MKRVLLAAVGAATMLAGATACSSIDPNAAVVNGRAIKVRDIEADVAALLKLRAPAGQAAPSTFAADNLRSILTLEIQAELAGADAAAHGAPIDDAARAATEQQFSNPNAFGERWSTAPAAVRKRLVEAQTKLLAGETLAGSPEGFNQKVLELMTAAKVTVNPRYGTWDPAAAAPIASLVPRLTTR